MSTQLAKEAIIQMDRMFSVLYFMSDTDIKYAMKTLCLDLEIKLLIEKLIRCRQ